ncbi:MAG: peptidylprolyl isomerase [Chloroflexi bacterium]|nr:peptidylprolyl isomerase [Chloroflexota bacterium]
MGTIKVELLKQEAPRTVANFIGLATGTKAWTDPATGKLTHRPLYNGTIFHRVIPQFMIQGGDPLGNGRGGPGYQFADEITSKITFDHPGYVAMANAGPDTNGSQFFITTAATPWLNGHYNLFGRVISGQAVADKISLVGRDQNDRPLRSVVIERILITLGSGR